MFDLGTQFERHFAEKPLEQTLCRFVGNKPVSAAQDHRHWHAALQGLRFKSLFVYPPPQCTALAASLGAFPSVTVSLLANCVRDAALFHKAQAVISCGEIDGYAHLRNARHDPWPNLRTKFFQCPVCRDDCRQVIFVPPVNKHI